MACVSFRRAPTSSMSAASRRGRARGRSSAEEELQPRPAGRRGPGQARRGRSRSTPAAPRSRGPASMPARASSTTCRRCATIPALLPLIVAAPRAGRADAPPRPVRRTSTTARPIATSSRTCATSWSSAAQAAEAAGIARDRIAFDPGIGFGKSVEENLALIAGAGRLAAAGYPVLIGVVAQELHRPADRDRGAAPARSGVGLAGGRGRPAGRRHRAGARRRRHPAGPRGLVRRCDRIAR